MEGVCSEEELITEVTTFNNELSFHLAEADTFVPKVN